MTKEELVGGASIQTVQPEGWLRRLLRAIFIQRLMDIDWGVSENPKGEWLLMRDGALSNARYHVSRVKNGITERRRIAPEEQAEYEAYLDLKDYQSW